MTFSFSKMTDIVQPPNYSPLIQTSCHNKISCHHQIHTHCSTAAFLPQEHQQGRRLASTATSIGSIGQLHWSARYKRATETTTQAASTSRAQRETVEAINSSVGAIDGIKEMGAKGSTRCNGVGAILSSLPTNGLPFFSLPTP